MNTQEINKFLESLRRQPIDMRDMNLLLQLIKQHDYKFNKDEILEISNLVSGHMNELFVTPNKVAELISVISEIYNPKSVIDICCGVGNILSYFKKLEIIKGLDINKSRIQWSEYINPDADLINANTLEWDFKGAKYDLVVGNLPLGARTSDGKPLAVELIKKGLNILNNNGIAIFIVNDGLLSASSRAEAELRQEILSNFALDMIISLPARIFPYMAVKTSILAIRNSRKNDTVFMPEFKDNSLEIAENFKQHKGDFYLPMSKITDRLDRNYYLSIEVIDEIIKGHKLVKLSDISEIIRGKALDRNSFATNGKYLSFNRKDRDGNNFIDSIPDERCILKEDDIVVSLIGPNNKVYLYKDNGVKTVITQNYAIIRPLKNDNYISTYLKTEEGQKLFQKQINLNLVGTTMPHLNISTLSNIDIPLLLLSKLNEDNLKNIAEISELEKTKIELENTKKELEEKNKQLEENMEKLKAAHKALHEKEKEMLSFFTHTMRNALATAPESLRQAIRLLGSEDYESNQKHYKAINKIAALFSTLSLTDCLIDTFKQSISEPEEFQRAWQNDHEGEATPKWVIAAALRQSLNRIIFMSDTSELRQLLNNADTPAIVAMRKSFIDNILPLNLDNQGISAFYQWLSSITTLEIAIENHDLHFGVNQVKFSLLFAISSELILNALKYWNGNGKIQIRWYTEQQQFIFKVTNACETNASSSLAGTHKGIAFIKRLMELLGEQAQFNCSVEEQLFIAELKLHQSLLEHNA